jgi:adenylate cyclase
MGVEIERKFLVKSEAWKSNVSKSLQCRQGYLALDKKKTVRVRVMGQQAFLTVKGATAGISRMEFEYEIDVSDAEQMLMLCEHLVEKTRHFIEYEGMTWELDVFEGENSGLIMAEIELESEEQLFAMPGWAGKEVSDDVRYFNGYLSKYPYGT